MATLAGLQEYLEIAEKHGLRGEDALKFANEQIDRAERARSRQEEKEEKEREREEKERERQERERERKHEIEVEKLRLDRAERERVQTDSEISQPSVVARPKLPAFADEKDNMDSYLNRFERMARAHGWPETEWAVNLSALLTGRALEVYSRLNEEDANDYSQLKEALLHRYGLTGEGYRMRLREARPEPDESPSQFIHRLSGYLQRWVDLTSTDPSFDGLKDLIVYEQFMDTCPKQLSVYLRERTGHCLEDLAEHAQKYLEAHGKSLNSLARRSMSIHDDSSHGPARSGGSATALRTSLSESSNCIFCHFPHPTEECRKSRNMTAVERREQLLRRGACYWCFQPGHRAADCRLTKPRCSACGGKHNQLVCDQRSSLASTNAINSDASDEIGRTASVTAASTNTINTRCTILMQTAQADAAGENAVETVRVMLDSGSNQSFIRTETARRLGCRKISQELLNVQTFGGSQTSPQIRTKVQVSLSATHCADNGSAVTISAYEIPTICSPPPTVTKDVLRKYPHLVGLKLAEEPSVKSENGEVDILIGLDYFQDIIDGRIKTGEAGPVAMGSRFGWILAGRSCSVSFQLAPKVANFVRTETARDLLEDLWELEGIGISSQGATDSNPKKALDDLASEHFQNNCRRLPDGRYETRWPWKPDAGRIPTNETQALARLEACEKQLQKNGRLKQYDDAIQDYLEHGHAERAPTIPDGPVHVLPHHAVYKRDKVRVVFDAAAGSPTQSLNDHLLTGPNLIADLTGVLLRFRMKAVGVTADIEKAFLQLSLHPEDRDLTRFLWREKATDQNPTVYRMTRVVFGVRTSPFLLQATIRKHLKQYEDTDKELTNLLRRDIYCDDLITCVDTEEEAQDLANRTIRIFEDAKMNMREWTVSQHTVSGIVEPKRLGDSPDSERKVLGISWVPEGDLLVFNTEQLVELAVKAQETKRSILRMTARFFDPLGVLAPFSVRTKLMLKSLWLGGLGWDQLVTEDVSKCWRKWLVELRQLDGLTLPRAYGLGTPIRYQLHVFCDASREAFAAVVYLRPEEDQTVCLPALVMCKSRLAPRQPISLPRLELTAALIGARLGSYVQQQLSVPPSSVHYWTDSMVALHWIRSDPKRWGVFVKNRIVEIQKLTSPEVWRHCPGAVNPADLPSRGAAVTQLKSDFWLHGPNWLKDHNEFWPSRSLSSLEPPECTEEERKQALPASTITEHASGVSHLIDIQRFSCLKKLLRVTAYAIRWVFNCRAANKRSGPLTASEIADAERLWISEAQRTRYGPEMEALENSRDVPQASTIRALNPVMEDGMLKKEGRLQHSALPEEERRPIILPPDHRLVDLLVEKTHRELCHAGTQQVLSAIRDRFWIVRGRQRIRAVLLRCRNCHIFRARHFDQKPAALPRSRATPARPFSRTGVDFAGPLYVKKCKDSVPSKAYIAVFTCAVVRAVHFEMVSSLRVEDFMKAYRRFTSHRGCPSSIMSDNATTFKAAASILASEGVTWQFIVERAPWWGGFWERVVGLTKAALRRTLGASMMMWEELETALCSVESAINARPLTPVTDDPADKTPLRPNDFLHCEVEQSGGSESEAERLTRRRRYQNRVVACLWNRWQRDYLRNLRDFHHSGAEFEPHSSDVVLIEDDRSSNRLAWVTGVIMSVHPGRDGRLRAATVHTRQGDIRRPIQKLYLLEAAEGR